MSEDDELPLGELLKRISQGDRIAEEKLYARYARKFDASAKHLLRKGRCWARDVHGPEITQLLWLRIFKALDCLKDRERFVFWAKEILKNLVLEHVAGPKGCKNVPSSLDEFDGQKRLPAAAIVPAHVTMESAVLWREICERAERIRPEFRQIIELHIVEGFTHDEISAKIGMTPANVRLIYSRGLKELEPFLGNEETLARSGILQVRSQAGGRPLDRF